MNYRNLFFRLYGRHSFLNNLFLHRFSNYPLKVDTPFEEAKYVVIDLELTGLNPFKDSIVSIGAVRMDGPRINLGDFFYRIVQTELCNKDSILIHGITPSETSLCPEINTILPEFIDYCKGRIIIGYFVSIDREFINKEAKKINKTLEGPFIETHKLYQWLNKKRINPDAFYEQSLQAKSLFEIARDMDISVSSLHNSIYDAYITAQVFQRLMHTLKLHGLKTVRDLLQIGGEI